MNKYEKLIEYIINENEQKARELFHEIVVEKSRDIYESLMDEDQMEENFGGDPAGNLVDEITADENGGVAEADDEFDMGGDDLGGDEMGGDFPADEGGDDFGGDEFAADGAGAEVGGEPDLESELARIRDEIDELLASSEGGDEGVSDFDGEGDGQSGTGSDEFGGDPAEVGAGDEVDAAGDEPEFGESIEEAKSGSGNPFAKKGSGASGSGKAASGKSGSGAAASGKSGSGKMEGKSVAQMMREYVDTIGQVYGGDGDSAEGTEVGTGKKQPINGKSISRTSGPDFGGTNKNIARGGSEQSPDGKPTPKPNNEYSKGDGGKFSNEKFQNQAGGSKKQSTVGKNWESEKGAEGQTTSGKVTVTDKTVLKQNTGK